MELFLKRIHAPAAADDGCRVLVDRLWPRGVARADAGIDHWLRDLAPSTALRRWFGHDPQKWNEFRRRYRSELASPPACAAFAQLRALVAGGRVTLLFAARDTAHNNAVALRELLLAGYAGSEHSDDSGSGG